MDLARIKALASDLDWLSANTRAVEVDDLTPADVMETEVAERWLTVGRAIGQLLAEAGYNKSPRRRRK